MGFAYRLWVGIIHICLHDYIRVCVSCPGLSCVSCPGLSCVSCPGLSCVSCPGLSLDNVITTVLFVLDLSENLML
jgi:hypothetical protein